MDYRSDFLIIGSGIAGLSAALDLARLGTVHVVTKKRAVESNTNFAQGGIAAVMEGTDSFDNHIRDTLTAGAGLCHEDIVRLVVQEGPGRIRSLTELGVRFSERENRFDLGLEGGHSHRRILHAGDLTGREIERALVEGCRKSGAVRVFEDHLAVDLILEDHPSKTQAPSNRCWGAYVLEHGTGEIHTFTARSVILASGGAGRVYLYTSNPDIATGDGMAMAYRAGAELRNLEFVQFHPTCLYNPGGATEEERRFLLSEALRGEGGKLLLREGGRFMDRYDKRGELAPRDIVARAIDAEMKRSGAPCVYLDMTGRPKDFLTKRFPNIYAHCERLGIDMAVDPVPVVPAAHFFCGGVNTDEDGATDLPGLYAIGEVSHTGLHGANRLASNSLLECSTFAHRGARRIESEWARVKDLSIPDPSPWDPGEAVPSDEAVVIHENWDAIRRLMWNYVGIVRSDRRLKIALHRARGIGREIAAYYWSFLLTPDLIELRNIALISELMVRCALARQESRGLHYNVDHPETLDDERRDTRISRYHGGRVSLGAQEAQRAK